MKKGLMSTVRRQTVELSIPLAIAISLATVFVAGSSKAAEAMSWIGLGPRSVPATYVGHRGGNDQPVPCDCNGDADSQPCPWNGTEGTKENCTLQFHDCTSGNNGPDTNYCVGSGMVDKCGGTYCKMTQYSTCVGTCK